MDRNTSDVFETEMLARQLYLGGMLWPGDCGGVIDRRCSFMGIVKRHGHGADIGHGLATGKLVVRSQIR